MVDSFTDNISLLDFRPVFSQGFLFLNNLFRVLGLRTIFRSFRNFNDVFPDSKSALLASFR